MDKQPQKIVEDTLCPKCGKPFYCSLSSRCWCYEYDVPSETMEQIKETYEGCLCPDCLKEFTR